MAKFVPRQRKHKVRKRLEQNDGNEGPKYGLDTNPVEIQSATATEREKKRQQMKQSLRAKHPKASGKKQKRLDKYIVGESFALRECVPIVVHHLGEETTKRRKPGPNKKVGKCQSRYLFVQQC